ncbi:uncharacterized protein LOC122574390 isoform X3 [Bombus pyrosoma]|uniref:uncharacterized protein LOC122574390 isoform X3 n=1 Tax=Bombus pyrosoma TaxID=396416 RepID=UPI001CB8AF98|nr:uncharacterized protein LOC122574390 isoform X3 [Bombus pyrosoma]
MVNFLQTKQVSFSLKYSLDLLSISRKCWKAVFPCTVEQASASLKRIKPLQELRNLLHLLWECSNSGSKAKNILHNLYFYHWIFNGSCLMSVFLMVLVGMENEILRNTLVGMRTDGRIWAPRKTWPNYAGRSTC